MQKRHWIELRHTRIVNLIHDIAMSNNDSHSGKGLEVIIKLVREWVVLCVHWVFLEANAKRV